MYGGMLEFKDILTSANHSVTIEGVNLDCTCNVWIRRVGLKSFEIDQMTIDNIVVVTDNGTTLPINKEVLESKYRKELNKAFQAKLDEIAMDLAHKTFTSKWDEADLAQLDT